MGAWPSFPNPRNGMCIKLKNIFFLTLHASNGYFLFMAFQSNSVQLLEPTRALGSVCFS